MSKNRYFITLLLTGLFSTHALAEPLTFSVDEYEDGRLTPTSVAQFEHYMAINHCAIRLVKQPQLKDQPPSSDLFFSARPNTLIAHQHEHYEAINTAIYQDNQPLTIAILIKSSTAVNDLTSMQGERLAIISDQSFLGGKQAKALLADAGIVLAGKNIIETGSYLGAMSLLLHGDVFIAAIPGALARRWQNHNKLSIIAESAPFKLGVILINSALSNAQKDHCRSAFSLLNKANRRDKKLNVFPSWLMGFK